MTNTGYPAKVAANVTYWQRQVDRWGGERTTLPRRERENIYRAVKTGLGFKRSRLAATRLALDLLPYIQTGLHSEEWIPMLRQAITSCPAGEPGLCVELWNGLGRLERDGRRWDNAREAHESALSIARHNRLRQLEGEALAHLSAVAFHQRRYLDAEAHGSAALEIMRSTAEKNSWFGFVWNTLGLTYAEQGKYRTAMAHYAAAVEAWKDDHRIGELARVYSNWSHCLQLSGQIEEAKAKLEAAWDIVRTGKTSIDVAALVTLNLAALRYNMEDLAGAERLFRSVNLGRLQRAGDRYYSAIAAQGLGNVLLALGRYEEATPYIDQAVVLWAQQGDDLELANSLFTKAEITAAQDKMVETCSLLQQTYRVLQNCTKQDRIRRIAQQAGALWRQCCRGEPPDVA